MRSLVFLLGVLCLSFGRQLPGKRDSFHIYEFGEASFRLLDLVQKHRRANNLSEVVVSPSLMFVAAEHVRDLSKNRPFNSTCNLHSWSVAGATAGGWKPLCYTNDQKKAQEMWNKPSEITLLRTPGFECVAEVATPEAALDLWKNSSAHNDVLLNRGFWRVPWKAVGAAFFGNYASIWFGLFTDKATFAEATSAQAASSPIPTTVAPTTPRPTTPTPTTAQPTTKRATRRPTTSAPVPKYKGKKSEFDESEFSDASYHLVHLINEYRLSKKLPEIHPSPSLMFVAHAHAKDLMVNRPLNRTCNFHSWSVVGSQKGGWKPVCYTDDHSKALEMWNKPGEITLYAAPGFECAAHATTPEEALAAWQISPAHNDVILNRGFWTSPWKAYGAAFYGRYATVWFGLEEDPAHFRDSNATTVPKTHKPTHKPRTTTVPTTPTPTTPQPTTVAPTVTTAATPTTTTAAAFVKEKKELAPTPSPCLPPGYFFPELSASRQKKLETEYGPNWKTSLTLITQANHRFEETCTPHPLPFRCVTRLMTRTVNKCDSSFPRNSAGHLTCLKEIDLCKYAKFTSDLEGKKKKRRKL